MRMQVYTFAQLYAACSKVGLKARLYLFDGGQTVEITDARGTQLIRDTEMWGDPIAVTDRVAKTLMERDLVTVFDFVGA
jgi:hypothetical protein